MGDIGDTFKELKMHRKEKKMLNKLNSTQMLDDSGIPFESKNNGNHLIVNGGMIDFYPSTGLWIVRGSNDKHRGVNKLIRFLMRYC